MSKEILKNVFDVLKSGNYNWSLYFFNVDKRSNQPFKAYKVRFKNAKYLPQYVSNLLNASEHFQIDTISKVQDYDGENTKVSCDKLSLADRLISNQWNSFCSAIASSSEKKIEGKINGYILCGESSAESDLPVTFVKIANPMTKLTNKKSVVFSATANNELDLITDDVCRLYLTVDFIVYNSMMYTFNHSFESIFSLEKTMSKVKLAAINEIVNTNAFSDAEAFKTFSSQYRSSRTFLTLKDERVNKIKDKHGRKAVASLLKLPLDSNGEFNIQTPEQASLLIRYLCFKILQDEETKNIFEGSTFVKLDI